METKITKTMSAEQQQEVCIERLRKLFGDRYDLSGVYYVNAKSKITLVCEQHGAFSAAPGNLFSGKGCPKCGLLERAAGRVLTRDEFVRRSNVAHKQHLGKYSYKNSEYKGNNVKLLILCTTCGTEFWQTPANHWKGKGCPKCWKKTNGDHFRKTTEQFVSEAKQLKDNATRYDYSETVYTDNHTPIKIRCKLHGYFKQTPSRHLQGSGCKKCADIATGNALRHAPEDVCKDMEEKHAGKYDYSNMVYHGGHVPVEIICPVHGSFMQAPTQHLLGQGCPKCGDESSSQKQRASTAYFIQRGTLTHKDRYTFENSLYIDSDTKLEVTCKLHGGFWVSPSNFYRGKGCPKCSHTVSGWEIRMKERLEHYGVRVIEQYRYTEDSRCRVDLYLPDYAVGIELNGTRYHTALKGPFGDAKSKYHHRDRADALNNHGIKLLQFWDTTDEQLITSMIFAKLGLHNPKDYARKLRLGVPTQAEADAFFDSNHVQGRAHGDVRVGLFDRAGYLMCCMQFNKKTTKGTRHSDTWELTRFATRSWHVVVGGMNRCLTEGIHQIKALGATHVISFADRDICPDRENNSYIRLGFKVPENYPCSPPLMLWYYDDKRCRRINRRQCQKQVFAKKYPELYDSTLTEYELWAKVGVYPVYNSGQWKFVKEI